MAIQCQVAYGPDSIGLILGPLIWKSSIAKSPQRDLVADQSNLRTIHEQFQNTRHDPRNLLPVHFVLKRRV